MPIYFNDYSELGNPKTRRVSTPPKTRKVSKPKAVRVTKTKNPYALKTRPGVDSTTVFRSTGKGGGISGSYNPLSISNPTGAPPPLRIVSSDAKPSKWGGLLGLASQYLAGSLRNSTVQTADGQTPIYNPRTNDGEYQPNYPANNQSNGEVEDEPVDYRRRKGAGADVGDSLGQGFDGIIKWASENPLIVAGFGFGAYLLMKQPPKYGNRG